MPSNTRDYMREFMRQYRATGRDKSSKRGASATRRFVGCDGEGATLANDYHAYFMLRIGDQTIRAHGDNVRLSSMECLDFISRQDAQAIHVGYFFDYDATKILEDLPLAKLDRLMNRRLRIGLNGQLFPVDYANFQLDYLPRKELKVRRMLSQTDTETEWSPWVVISDVGTFFQMSFLRSLQVWKVGTEDEHKKISDGKQQRARFDIQDFDQIAEYNALEIRLLQQLMDRFRDACIQAGYVPSRWQGPGLLAETMLRAHGVPKTTDISLLNDDEYGPLLKMAQNAYYGGRFEVTQIGPISVPVFQDDINSAYPHAMRFVPCLQHGGWESGSVTELGLYDRPTGKHGEKFALVYGSFTLKEGHRRPLLYGLPVRTAVGSIVYPEQGRGWYWSFEVESAIHQEFTVEEAWTYTRVCDCRPLGFVEDVYLERQRIGKDGPGLILKLGLNSLYGKQVQSIGSPKYANAIWGSFITAFPRMMIQDYIHTSDICQLSCGRDIVMIATDSVASLRERRDVDVSSSLGSWSREVHERGMFIVQPGVYFGTSGKPTKTRGFTRTVVDTYEEHFRSAFMAMVDSGDLSLGQVALPVQVFVGIRHALHRRNLKLLGQWIEYGTESTPGKVLSFDWTSKRLPLSLNPTLERPWILTLPYQGGTDVGTVPYSKDIGGLLDRESDRIAFEGQPDWSPMGDMYDV